MSYYNKFLEIFGKSPNRALELPTEPSTTTHRRPQSHATYHLLMASTRTRWATIQPESIDGLFQEAKGIVRPFSKVFYVPQGSHLKFVIAAGSSDYLLRDLSLFINYPAEGKKFDRKVFQEIKASPYNGLDDWVAELRQPIQASGFFEYYFQCLENGSTVVSSKRSFNVEPDLKLNGKPLPAEGIVIQTALTKCLGHLDDWQSHFQESSELGYNMIHFTPVQELGFSGSAYSLYDQVSIEPTIFTAKTRANGKTAAKQAPAFPQREVALQSAIQKMEKDFGLLSMTDVVLNHTANNTPWLADHPEAGYNLDNSPHLRKAFDVDEALLVFSTDIHNGVYMDIPKGNFSEDDVRHLLSVFRRTVWPQWKMWEYYVVDVASTIAQVSAELRGDYKFDSRYGADPMSDSCFDPLKTLMDDGIRDDGHQGRFSLKIDLDVLLSIFGSEEQLSPSDVEKRMVRMRQVLDQFNAPGYHAYDTDTDLIIQNLFHRINRGPLLPGRHITDNYFTRVKGRDGRQIALANNGWIWAGNPLINFAGPESNAYYLREVIIWGDCVKLRYGLRPTDSPWLWDHMTKYCEWSAKLFHGLRIDNAHSTPIHVAQHLLDAARRIRPDLYVMAELFTGSQELDEHFVASWGINALIREAMQASDSWDLGRYIHRYGGSPVGSVSIPPGGSDNFVVLPSPPLSIVVDCTHDNETPQQKRTPEDTLSSFGLVAMAASAIGSTTGYDQLVAKNIDVVHEKKRYSSMKKDGKWKGVGEVKAILNRLHTRMATEKYGEVHVHQVDNLIAVQRHRPADHSAVYLIAHTAFNHGAHHLSPETSVVKVPAKITSVIVGARITVPRGVEQKDDEEIAGVESSLEISTRDASQFADFRVTTDATGSMITEVHLKNFYPGSILAFNAEPFPEQQKSLVAIREQLADTAALYKTLEAVNLVDLNVLLYRCKEEEEATFGSSTFDIPNYGRLMYCGIASFDWLLEKLRPRNDMGHPLFGNLRDGNWILDYVTGRLQRAKGLDGVRLWLEKIFDEMKRIPRFLIPKYFDQCVSTLYHLSTHRALSSMSSFVRPKSETSHTFSQKLALGSVQLYSSVQHASLLSGTDKPSLAAGLPHFSSGYMRAWGRDTFIAIRGLLMVTGRLEEARDIITTCAGFIRHGLMPNLLDGGQNPRYNARDATWWFLQSVQDYCTIAPEGIKLLDQTIDRLFPHDEQEKHSTWKEKKEPVQMKLSDVIHEIFTKHANGIQFREWNAGTRIDAHMRDEGFNIRVYTDWSNGFVFGGNVWNCGTWMDKMGESQKAGSQGFPGTPRDGADVEIVGMLKSTLRWLSSLHEQKKFPHAGVEVKQGDGTTKKVTFKEWDQLVQRNFENYFYVPEDPKQDEAYHVRTEHVNRRGIYRDTVGSTQGWSDYQLRPNAPVAMAVAPELFNRDHARRALAITEEVLVGPLGMATLDPSDFNYEPDYDMSIDTDNRRLSKGFNYHQGPEWVWVLGYYLRAYANFEREDKRLTRHHISHIIVEHKKHITESPWRGIHELTNKNGSECHYSCPTQAWSLSCLLDTLYDLRLE
ncbi:putative glycogen debranching enzyme Gdb1 [Planoprotostelium fungivorum]|uniref:Glycogen debranching enzyme n=1 Tax=Planoprotostelium fungivorum TaxID=1890364 RepID=A0A2P6MUF0_9EUKA|nr:putative glycogen debranching enzyme Gdb1 [Planoprotostelium fungivorum]